MYLLEFYYQGEVIERREYPTLPIQPLEGERIRFFGFTNPNYNQISTWWVVVERQHIFAPPKNPKGNPEHILMLRIEPDPKDGMAKNDPLYQSYIKKEK